MIPRPFSARALPPMVTCAAVGPGIVTTQEVVVQEQIHKTIIKQNSLKYLLTIIL
jgi:hypothetical protein